MDNKIIQDRFKVLTFYDEVKNPKDRVVIINENNRANGNNKYKRNEEKVAASKENKINKETVAGEDKKLTDIKEARKEASQAQRHKEGERAEYDIKINEGNAVDNEEKKFTAVKIDKDAPQARYYKKYKAQFQTPKQSINSKREKIPNVEINRIESLPSTKQEVSHFYRNRNRNKVTKQPFNQVVQIYQNHEKDFNRNRVKPEYCDTNKISNNQLCTMQPVPVYTQVIHKCNDETNNNIKLEGMTNKETEHFYFTRSGETDKRKECRRKPVKLVSNNNDRKYPTKLKLPIKRKSSSIHFFKTPSKKSLQKKKRINNISFDFIRRKLSLNSSSYSTRLKQVLRKDSETLENRNRKQENRQKLKGDVNVLFSRKFSDSDTSNKKTLNSSYPSNSEHVFGFRKSNRSINSLVYCQHSSSRSRSQTKKVSRRTLSHSSDRNRKSIKKEGVPYCNSVGNFKLVQFPNKQNLCPGQNQDLLVCPPQCGGDENNKKPKPKPKPKTRTKPKPSTSKTKPIKPTVKVSREKNVTCVCPAIEYDPCVCRPPTAPPRAQCAIQPAVEVRALVKYCLMCLVVIIWLPCIFLVALCWMITYPMRPQRDGYGRKKPFWCSFVKWIKAANWYNLSILEVMTSLLTPNNRPVHPCSLGKNDQEYYGPTTSTSQSRYPDKNRQYTLCHSNGRGWVMKPLKENKKEEQKENKKPQTIGKKERSKRLYESTPINVYNSSCNVKLVSFPEGNSPLCMLRPPVTSPGSKEKRNVVAVNQAIRLEQRKEPLPGTSSPIQHVAIADEAKRADNTDPDVTKPDTGVCGPSFCHPVAVKPVKVVKPVKAAKPDKSKCICCICKKANAGYPSGAPIPITRHDILKCSCCNKGAGGKTTAASPKGTAKCSCGKTGAAGGICGRGPSCVGRSKSHSSCRSRKKKLTFWEKFERNCKRSWKNFGLFEENAWDPVGARCGELYLQTMRTRPCFWIYECCPAAYPFFLTMSSFYKNFCHMMLYGLAACVWVPWMFCCYCCSQMICKCF